MKLIITELTIENFKGIRNPLKIQFDNKLTSIYGANHSGKTTTMDATMWLLFGKNSLGETNFGIDPLDNEGNVIHNLENSVKAKFAVDGREITLHRVRKEVWKKVRGEDSETYSHTTNFYIDGAKFTEKEYKAYISERLVDENLFRAITNPTYFPTLKPAEQRKLLISMTGETTDEAVASKNPQFRELLEELNGTTLEEYQRHVAYTIKEIKRELETLPSRIVENNNALEYAKEKLQGISIEAELQQVIAEKEKALQSYNEQLSDLSKVSDENFSKLSTMRNEVNSLKAKLQSIEREIHTQNSREREKKADAIFNVQSEIRKVTARLESAKQDIQLYQQRLNNLDTCKIDFRKRWRDVESMAFVWSGAEICEHCGQPLPQENIDGQKVIAQNNFNQRKQRLQDELDHEAQGIKENERNLQASLSNAQTIAEKAEQDLGKLQLSLKEAEQMEVVVLTVSDSSEYAQIEKEISVKQQEIEDYKQAKTSTEQEELRSKLEQERRECQKQIDNLKDQLRTRRELGNTIAYHTERIAEITKQEKELNQQLTKEEQNEDNAKEFEFAKITLLQDTVNNMFSRVRFKMFNRLMNGNFEPTCECTLHGTPYQNLSNSEKMNASLDIISAFCKYHQAYAPIYIDNAESNTDIIETESQQVRLYVSYDEKLKVVI